MSKNVDFVISFLYTQFKCFDQLSKIIIPFDNQVLISHPEEMYFLRERQLMQRVFLFAARMKKVFDILQSPSNLDKGPKVSDGVLAVSDRLPSSWRISMDMS